MTRDRGSRAGRHLDESGSNLNYAAVFMGVIGFGAAMFALGRSGREGADCCDKLVLAQGELATTQNRLLLGH